MTASLVLALVLAAQAWVTDRARVLKPSTLRLVVGLVRSVFTSAGPADQHVTIRAGPPAPLRLGTGRTALPSRFEVSSPLRTANPLVLCVLARQNKSRSTGISA